ncbi:MAG TPA: hypothetical protein VJ966_15300, partial [Actinomycetes bacterium]|nr:hypothetical protein [Actinomycetes bacterium]
MPALPAHLVAIPVLECLTGEGRGTVLGAGATAAWVDLDGFVVAITTREVPLLPNAIALAAGSGALAGAGSGATARLGPGRATLGQVQVTWDPAAPPRWDPTVPVPTGVTREALGTRAAALLHALRAGAGAETGAVDNHLNLIPRSATLPHRGPAQPEGAEAHARGREAEAHARVRELVQADAEAHARVRDGEALAQSRNAEAPARVRELVEEMARIGVVTATDPEGADGLALLFRAVAERDPDPAVAAARALLGRGPGLTPEGDDLLAAVAGTLAVLGPAVGMPDRPREPPL